ncbi:serine hydrolase [Cupriavidus sp. NPDC089707]|uniref:serine hydrolase n=1 Tax=Cupriavidus sp. NPDC089707 TaxID=3363963 RepID=UPI0037FC105A
MLEGFDALVQAAMDDWKIPGLALAILHDGEPMLVKGYGVRDMAEPAPVTASTQFLLCSLTKSLTAAGLGLLVDARELDWSTPVRDVVPGFRLQDPVATASLTVRDLLSHQSGLPRHDWIHSPGDLDIRQMLDRLPHLAPSRGFREVWQYQNLGYVIAGHVAERITGQRWEDFTAERLLRPLGFSRFSFSTQALAAEPDHAHPHVMDRGECLRAAWAPIRATAAGGLNASVEDFARWMRCLLDEGKADGQPLLSPPIVRDMTAPRVHVCRAEYDEVGDIHYGLGLTVEHYRGERTVSHSGSWLGWAGLMTLLPARRIGIAVLTNRAPSAVTALLTYAALDRLCGHAPIDWFGRLRTRRQEMLAQMRTDKAAQLAQRRPDTTPSHALHEYAGIYAHPAYGEIIIESDGAGLAWQWRGMTGKLTHRHYDVFTTAEKLTEIHPDNLALTFLYDRDGHIDRIAAPFEPLVEDIVFRRTAGGAAAVAADAGTHARWIGEYRHAGTRIDIGADAAGGLVLDMTGQPTRRLLALHDTVFQVEGLPQFRVACRVSEDGEAATLVFHQPNGTFVATRVVQ